MSDEPTEQEKGPSSQGNPIPTEGNTLPAKDEPSQSKAADLKDGPGSSYLNMAGVINANQAITANTLNYVEASGESWVRKLSAKHFDDRRAQDKLFIFKKVHFHKRKDVDPLVQHLEQKPFLVLTGGDGIGKTSLAIAASTQLTKPVVEVLICRSLDNYVRVNFQTLVEDEPGFQDRCLILTFATTPENSDVLRFLRSVTKDQLEACMHGLRRSHTLLIVTIDQWAIPGEAERLKNLGILCEVSTPSVETLLEGFRHLALRALPDVKDGEDLASKIDNLLAKQGERIVQELRGMSWVATFVRDHLPQVLLDPLKVEEALGQALVRVKDLSPWILEALPKNLEAWCAAVSLTLCSAAKRSGGVSWFQFEALRQELLRFTQHEMGRLRPRRKLAEICGGPSFLQEARIEVEPGALSEADIVRFNPELPRAEERLWQAFLGQGREVIAALAPFLRDLVHGDDVFLGQIAASALGRIGQIDPVYVALPLIVELTRAAPDEKSRDDHGALRRGILLGHFYRGVFAARERDSGLYTEKALQHLRSQIRSDSIEAVRTVLMSLAPIAAYDEARLGDAMSLLRESATRWLRPQWDDLWEISSIGGDKELARHFFKSVRGHHGNDEEVQKLIDDVLVSAVVAQESWAISRAFQYTLASLFFSPLTQRPVLANLLEWSREDEERLGPLLTYVFLRSGGIGVALTRLAPATVLQTNTTTTTDGSPFLESLHADPEMAELLASFLEQAYVHLQRFPGRLRLQLEDGFVRILAAWSREARTIPRLRPVVVGLVSALFESSMEELSERVLRFAQESPPFTLTSRTGDLHDLHRIAIEAVGR